MLGTDFTKNKKAQSGSVMLEVIAVLALMGVMGAMLFRQIYQRNQELHNIQMASEIRTVKEAFSAYIQAHRTELLGVCHASDDSRVVTKCSKTSEAIGDAIKDYLPMGWFNEGNPNYYYTLSLWTYKLADASQKQVIHGLIAPKETTLPSTGWNFKRAARVALLIGADGGVYDGAITGNTIAGALGTWQLRVDGQMQLLSPTYVAMTGLDIFTPEYNLPEGNVNLYDDWDLATQKLGAWNYFSAGSDKGCFDVNHGEVEDQGGRMMVKNDIFDDCQPLFYVDNAKSKVFVNNDLEIGQGENANVTITQEGVIKQKYGLTIDANGRIISQDKLATAIGDLKKDDPYVIDPKYTSVMGDILLVSRGGVRLSDILPNYILKEVKTITGGDDITIPTCPTGYKKAIVVTPVSWDQVVTKQPDIGLSNDEEGKTMGEFPVSGNVDLSKLEGVADGANVSFSHMDAGKDLDDFSILNATADLSELKAEAQDGTITEGICVKITKSTTTTDGLKAEESTITGKWEVVLGYKNDDDSCTSATDIKAIAQTYCVYNNTGVSADITLTECEAAGFTWDNDTTNGKVPHCSYVYSATNINKMTDDTKKVATCKAAGFTWNGTNCTNP